MNKKALKPQRIQKVLAHFGVGSRRQIEDWIKNNRLTLNNQVIIPGTIFDGKGVLHLDNKLIKLNPNKSLTKLLLYNKPVGEVCSTNDPFHKNTVFDSLPKLTVGRWVSIGRLDISSSGLLLFTNNGELANRLMHPKANISRQYLVRVSGKLDLQQQKGLLNGIKLEDGISKFTKVEHQHGQGRNHWYKVALTRGRYREIRRMFQALGLEISALMRVQFASIKLPRDLKPGKFKYIDPIPLVL